MRTGLFYNNEVLTLACLHTYLRDACCCLFVAVRSTRTSHGLALTRATLSRHTVLQLVMNRWGQHCTDSGYTVLEHRRVGEERGGGRGRRVGSIRPDSRVGNEKGVACYRRSCPSSRIVATVYCCGLVNARYKQPLRVGGSTRPDSRVGTEKGVKCYWRSCPSSRIVATVFCWELESAHSKAAYIYTFQCRCEAARQIVFLFCFLFVLFVCLFLV